MRPRDLSTKILLMVCRSDCWSHFRCPRPSAL